MKIMEPVSRSLELIDHNDCFIMIIDVQDYFMNHIQKEDKEVFLKKIVHLIRLAQVLKIPTILTAENIQKNGSVNEMITAELGEKIKILDKFIYSCWGQQNIQDEIKKHQRSIAVLCGLETDVCVMQTAIDLLSNSYRVVLLDDLTYSRNQNEHTIGIKRIEHHGGIISLLKTWQEEITGGIQTSINQIIKSNELDDI